MKWRWIVQTQCGTQHVMASWVKSGGLLKRWRAGEHHYLSGTYIFYCRNSHKLLPRRHQQNPTMILQVLWTPATLTLHWTWPRTIAQVTPPLHLCLRSIYFSAVPNNMEHTCPTVHPPTLMLNNKLLYWPLAWNRNEGSSLSNSNINI